MAIDPSIYRGIDTQFGLKLADLFNPTSIAQRQSAADEQAMGSQLRQMQVLQGVEQMRRAPVLAQREDQQYQMQQEQRQAQIAEAQRAEQERARRQAMIEQLPENQRRLIDFGVSPEKVLMPKEEKLPTIIQEMRAAGISETSPEGQKMLRNRLIKETTHAPSAKVSVGFPKETFKNEMDLRKEFEGLPTTKAYKEVQSAYDQVTTALKRPSAANDLVAATKFMKILDPNSVVRESELMMAMEATGKLDQFMNYANRIQTGQKLTESQRKDFRNSVEALYGAATTRYNTEASNYRNLAKNYELNPERIARPSDFVPTKPAGALIKTQSGATASGW